jgi:hypothetical protein
MSTPNVAAAAAAARARARSSNTPKPSTTLGFDVVAKHLTDHFHTAFNTKAEKCRGVNSHAHKHLISSFTASLKGVKASVSSAVSTITPSTSIRQSRRSSTSSISTTTPISFPSLVDYAADDSVTLDQPHFLDQRLIPVSSNLLPPKRLRIAEILRLRVNDEFILFVPPENKNNPAEMRSTREYILDRMQRMITQTFAKTTTTEEREIYFEQELKAREVEREGRIGHEFHVRILAYPERDQMSIDRLPTHELNFLLNPQTGVGITVQLTGYNTNLSCLIKLHNIPFLEI